MTDLWHCWVCDAPGIRNIGINGYCATHLTDLLDTFDPSNFAFAGVGRFVAHGTDEYNQPGDILRCNAEPSHTWVGIVGEPCRFCVSLAEARLQWQAALVLEPPDVDPDDVNHQTRTVAWVERMAVAARAGIITVDQARRTHHAHQKAA